MEFRTNKKDLLAALSSAAAVAASDEETPVLGCILLAAGEGRLTVTGTDLALFLSGTVAADVRAPGCVAVPASQLHKVVKALPGERLRLKLLGGAVLEIATARDRYELGAVPATDFPDVPAEEGVSWASAPASLLAGLLARVLPFASRDEGRQHLSAVSLDWEEGRARAVATDGHRMAVATSTDPEAWRGVLRDGENLPLLPRPGVKEILRFLKGAKEAVELGIAKEWLFVRRSAVMLSVHLVGEAFPPWEQVMPKLSDRSCIVERQAFAHAIKRALVVVPRGVAPGVRLHFEDGSLTVEAGIEDISLARIALDVDYQGEQLTIGANGRFLLDGLSLVGADLIWLGMCGPLSPLLLKPCLGSGQPADDFAAIVMPMNLGDEDPEARAQQEAAAENSRGPLFGDEPPVSSASRKAPAIETVTISAPGMEPVTMTGEAFATLGERVAAKAKGGQKRKAKGPPAAPAQE